MNELDHVMAVREVELPASSCHAGRVGANGVLSGTREAEIRRLPLLLHGDQ
jgi:hypothetical protein